MHLNLVSFCWKRTYFSSPNVHKVGQRQLEMDLHFLFQQQALIKAFVYLYFQYLYYFVLGEKVVDNTRSKLSAITTKFNWKEIAILATEINHPTTRTPFLWIRSSIFLTYRSTLAKSRHHLLVITDSGQRCSHWFWENNRGNCLAVNYYLPRAF